MKRILIIAGANGAGKTTFASEFLPNEANCFEFVNADLIAAGLSPFQPNRVALTAGRLMLSRIADLIESGETFAFETTLASRGYLRLIPSWQRSGYHVELCFLKLPDAHFAIRRVEQRVRLGGHDIPHPTIRRRFERGLKNLQPYLDIVDEWAIYDNSKAPHILLERGGNQRFDAIMEAPPEYKPTRDPHRSAKSSSGSIFIGADAAFKRAAAKAIARARRAGLEPVISNPIDEKADI